MKKTERELRKEKAIKDLIKHYEFIRDKIKQHDVFDPQLADFYTVQIVCLYDVLERFETIDMEYSKED